MKKTNEVSKLAGVSRRTLQFYDDEGMVKVKRSQNNYRLYDSKALEQLWQVLIYKEIGLELKEIKQLVQKSEVEQKKYLKLQMKKLEQEIWQLKEQKMFISSILTQGLPQLPEEEETLTYLEMIARLREKCRNKATDC